MSSAVFLSYASQDADAAKRICEALRAAGVEVWFDQNELVGGDAWDVKAREPIQGCVRTTPMALPAHRPCAWGPAPARWRREKRAGHEGGRPAAAPVDAGTVRSLAVDGDSGGGTTDDAARLGAPLSLL